MESKIITPIQIHEYFMELTKNHNFIESLNSYEILEVKKYAEKMLSKSEREAIAMMDSNPDYHYSEYYSYNHIQFWLKHMRSNTDYLNCKKVLDIITTFIPNDDKRKGKPTKFNGFQSNLNKIQIKYLFEQLKGGNYIDKNTYEDNFNAIFRNEALPDNCKISWLKTNVLLAYLVKKLFHTDNYLDVWVKAEKIFGIKNLNKSECNNPKPKGYKSIDTILINMYNHL